jgi:hypothetical protein
LITESSLSLISEIFSLSSVASLFSLSSILTTCQARERQPYLAQFENDWATADIVKQFLRSRRKYLVSEAKRSKEKGSSNVRHIDDDEADGSGVNNGDGEDMEEA